MRNSPLLIFLFVGVLLFLLEQWRGPLNSDSQRILVSAIKVEQLEKELTNRYGQLPSLDQLDAELQAYIDEELLYREALRLELYKNDVVVRRRLAQTLAFIIEGEADSEIYTEADIRRQFVQRSTTSQPRFDFSHVFFSFDNHKGHASEEATKALKLLDSGAVSQTEIGDPFLMGSKFEALSKSKLVANFGQGFADALMNVDTSRWSGPFSSTFGYHVVLVSDIETSALVYNEQLREKLINSLRSQRRRELREEALNRLRQQYDVEIEMTRSGQTDRQ